MTNDINTVTTVTTSLLFLKEGEDRGSIEKVRKGGEVVTNDDGEQGPDTDGLAVLQDRIARKEAANEALVAKLEATMLDIRSLQRRNEEWAAECQRLSSLLIENERKLTQRMAIPLNALKHGGVR